MTKQYTVRFSETVHYTATVTADTPQEACAQVRELFEQGGYVHEETTYVSDYVAEAAPNGIAFDLLQQADGHISTAAKACRESDQNGVLGALIHVTAILQAVRRNIRNLRP